MTDNQFNELFGLLTKAVGKLNEHDEKFERIENKLNEHDEKFERIENKLNEHDEKFERIEDKLSEHDVRFEELNTSLNDFRQETRTNFEKVNKEIGSEHRKISYLANQFLEIKAENEDLKERVTALEEKSAA